MSDKYKVYLIILPSTKFIIEHFFALCLHQSSPKLSNTPLEQPQVQKHPNKTGYMAFNYSLHNLIMVSLATNQKVKNRQQRVRGVPEMI